MFFFSVVQVLGAAAPKIFRIFFVVPENICEGNNNRDLLGCTCGAVLGDNSYTSKLTGHKMTRKIWSCYFACVYVFASLFHFPSWVFQLRFGTSPVGAGLNFQRVGAVAPKNKRDPRFLTMYLDTSCMQPYLANDIVLWVSSG